MTRPARLASLPAKALDEGWPESATSCQPRAVITRSTQPSVCCTSSGGTLLGLYSKAHDLEGVCLGLAVSVRSRTSRTRSGSRQRNTGSFTVWS